MERSFCISPRHALARLMNSSTLGFCSLMGFLKGSLCLHRAARGSHYRRLERAAENAVL
jgi:hypothetical protein